MYFYVFWELIYFCYLHLCHLGNHLKKRNTYTPEPSLFNDFTKNFQLGGIFQSPTSSQTEYRASEENEAELCVVVVQFQRKVHSLVR